MMMVHRLANVGGAAVAGDAVGYLVKKTGRSFRPFFVIFDMLGPAIARSDRVPLDLQTGTKAPRPGLCECRAPAWFH